MRTGKKREVLEMTLLETQGEAARKAARVLARTGTKEKNEALEAIARALEDREEEILSANAEDMEEARGTGMSEALLDRLELTRGRIKEMAEGVRHVAALPDPVGQMESTVRPNGLIIGQKRVPLGVIGMIYEARPNVTVDAAALCLKAGSACILRGGKEAFRSNRVLTSVLRDALEEVNLPRDCAALVQGTDRESAQELMNLTKYLDVLIPRGGRGLIRAVAEQARVPVIRTGEGVCHIYVDRDADLQMACEIVYNAKCSRPSVCNAVECLLVHRAVAQDFLPMVWEFLRSKKVEIRGCSETRSILRHAAAAKSSDWDAEYGDYVLAVLVVGDADEAMDFIAQHGTGHSEAIITENYTTAQRFLNEVDAAAVYVNASTRFTDGGEFGLGAEIGISTQKLHARGPMGLEALTTTKYVVYGNGQVR